MPALHVSAAERLQSLYTPLFATVPDMEAVMAILPLIFRLIISFAAAWIVRNMPARQLSSLAILTCHVDIHHSPKVRLLKVHRGAHELYARRSKEAGDRHLLALLVVLFVCCADDLLDRLGIRDIQLAIDDL